MVYVAPVLWSTSALGKYTRQLQYSRLRRRGRDTQQACNARARAGRGRGRWGTDAALGPRRPCITTSTGHFVCRHSARNQSYTLHSAGRVAGTSLPLLNKNTHTVDEQRCIVRVECGPSYRFAYLLLPLQHVRHRDVFGEVHLAVEHDALAQDRRDVHGILVVLVAGYCSRLAFVSKYTYKLYKYMNNNEWCTNLAS